jgi:hypothetical protein
MNWFKSMFFTSAFVALVCLVSGCTQFDYVGQKLTPLSPDQFVAFYNSKNEVPPDTYKVLGRAEVTAPDGTNTESVKAEILEKAREYGADAVEVVLFKRVKTGEVVIPKHQTYSGPTGSWVVTSNRPDGTPIYTDSFVENVPLQTSAVDQFEIQAKVLFLAKKEKLEKAIDKYKEERKSYLHGSSRFAQ